MYLNFLAYIILAAVSFMVLYACFVSNFRTAAQELDGTAVKEEPSNLEDMDEDGNGDQVCLI